MIVIVYADFIDWVLLKLVQMNGQKKNNKIIKKWEAPKLAAKNYQIRLLDVIVLHTFLYPT